MGSGGLVRVLGAVLALVAGAAAVVVVLLLLHSTV